MKLLFDQNLSFKLVERLSDLFPESSQVRLHGLDRAEDLAIWDFAKQRGYTLVTMDSDFADLAALRGSPPKVIWLRCGNQPSDAIEALVRRHASQIVALETDEQTACLEIL